jgi:hypothetical protein
MNQPSRFNRYSTAPHFAALGDLGRRCVCVSASRENAILSSWTERMRRA